MAFAQINNTQFYYELHGAGQPLVLISGYTCDHTFWQPVLDELIKHYQVLIFDNHGVGQTKDHHQRLTAEIMANEIMLLIEHLQLQKPHIVGQSMGGTIAQVIASSYPDNINKLGILNSVVQWREAMLVGIKSILTMREQNIDFDLIFDASLAWVYGEVFLKDQKQVAELKKLILENPYPQSVFDQARQFNVLKQFDGRSQIKNIKANTLVVYGVEDLLSLPGESKFLAHEIKNAELIEFDCGHDSVLEKTQELTHVLKDFLR